jgi:hypothetical protein
MPTNYSHALEEVTRFPDRGGAQVQLDLDQLYGLGLAVEVVI